MHAEPLRPFRIIHCYLLDEYRLRHRTLFFKHFCKCPLKWHCLRIYSVLVSPIACVLDIQINLRNPGQCVPFLRIDGSPLLHTLLNWCISCARVCLVVLVLLVLYHVTKKRGLSFKRRKMRVDNKLFLSVNDKHFNRRLDISFTNRTAISQ